MTRPRKWLSGRRRSPRSKARQKSATAASGMITAARMKRDFEDEASHLRLPQNRNEPNDRRKHGTSGGDDAREVLKLMLPIARAVPAVAEHEQPARSNEQCNGGRKSEEYRRLACSGWAPAHEGSINRQCNQGHRREEEENARERKIRPTCAPVELRSSAVVAIEEQRRRPVEQHAGDGRDHHRPAFPEIDCRQIFRVLAKIADGRGSPVHMDLRRRDMSLAAATVSVVRKHPT